MAKISLLLLASLGLIAAAAAEATPLQSGKKVVCYYTNWSVYRSGNAAYRPSDINPGLCTHIMYSFATLDPNTLEMSVYDQELDIDQGFYQQVTSLKERGVKVSIALGGWSDSAGNKYSRMVNNAASRANFVSKAVQFIQTHNFDGLDLDWEYPKCWQADCSAGPASDKENFANLVRELRAAFQPHGFLLSSAVSASRSVISQAYDVPTLSANLDWIGLMTYDMHGGWDGQTGHNSPFQGPPPNTADTILAFLEAGAAAEKLVVGVPLYGRSFTLNNINDNGVGAPATNGAPGQYTEEEGFLAYFEFCSGWTYRHILNVGPYAYRGDQWASYDDVDIIRQKATYINSNNLGGAMVWAIDLDDFNGSFCSAGRYPLLTALKNALS